MATRPRTISSRRRGLAGDVAYVGLLSQLWHRDYLGGGWYEIPTIGASVHLHLRLDCPCRGWESDLVMIEGGRVTAYSWFEQDVCFGSEDL